MNRNYSVCERGCPLHNALLFTVKFLLFLSCSKESNFSVKSNVLRRDESLSYMEQFLFVLSFNVAPYFQLRTQAFLFKY